MLEQSRTFVASNTTSIEVEPQNRLFLRSRPLDSLRYDYPREIPLAPSRTGELNLATELHHTIQQRAEQQQDRHSCYQRLHNCDTP